jgi:long-chain acyl-CoA synthetase
VRTIPQLWRNAMARRSGPGWLVEEGERWREVPWTEVAPRVDDTANGLLAAGIAKGDHVGILASTCLDWVVVDLALAHVGGVSVPIYPNSSARDVAYLLGHSESAAVFVADEEQRAKVDAGRGDLPALREVFAFAELGGLADRGRVFAAANPTALDDAVAAVGEEDVYTVLYTSGTTGPPKGCMMRHRNYYEMVCCVDRLGDLLGPADVMLLYLPLAHNFGRLLHLAGFHVGYVTALLPDPLRTGEVLPVVRPTLLPSVPRVFEKVYTTVRAQFDAATGVKRRLIDRALETGRQASPYRQRDVPLPRSLAVRHALYDRLVYSKVKERLGGRLRFGISGGAPLAQEIAEFFHALDVLILEGYGLTECTTAATVNRPTSFRFGTVGPALPGFELQLADDGEVLIRSETIFAGYLKDEEATRGVVDADGWLHSGDIGSIDAEGFLRITDRKKDILVTAGGKNVAPQNIENALKSKPIVSQAVVVGDRRPYLIALLTLDRDVLTAWAAEHALQPDVEALAGHPEVHAAVQAVVDDVNRDASRYEQVKRFAVLPRDFSLDEGELTATLKLRRRVVEEHFADEIERLYTEPRS